MSGLESSPRIYLDTAMLAQLADMKIPASEVEDLHSIMREKGAILIISYAHLQDMHRGTDEATKLRFESAIDSFPTKGVVLNSQIATERIGLGPALQSGDVASSPSPLDLRIFPFTKMEEFVKEHTTMSEMGEKLTELHEANLSNHQARIGANPVDPDNLATIATMNASGKSVREMLQQLRGPDADPIQIERDLLLIPPGLLEQAAGFIPLLTRSDFDISATVRQSLKRPAELRFNEPTLGVKNPDATMLRIAPTAAPGLFLSYSLLRKKYRNTQRVPRPGDYVDEEHVSFAPYVDVSTWDKENLETLRQELGSVRKVRKGIVIPNRSGTIRSVIDNIAQL